MNCKTEQEGVEFKKALVTAKETQPPEKAWRVDTDSHTGKDYVGTKTYISEGGSTFSVKPDGDIISVCKNKNDKMYADDLMNLAIKAGGRKLDSFDGNFQLYLRNGFEPVSWTAFDIKQKPKGWDASRNKPEPIIFFKYTGKK